MIVAIAETHAAIWYLFSDPRLGKSASVFIDDTIANSVHLGVSAITIAEMVYLVEKGRIPANALNDLHPRPRTRRRSCGTCPLDEAIALKMTEIPRQAPPDLPDRIVAATAPFFSVPVLSRDSRIRSSSLQTIW